MANLLQRIKAALGDRYAVQRELGRGGMSTVFLADEQHPKRLVAIKVLDPTIGAVLGPDRFLREVDLASKLTHPHILPIHAAGDVDGLLYYVMPFVEGESLRHRLINEKQLPVDDALQIAREVADALSYAHSRDVIHRDIKPENILLESGHAVVADFGIARAITVAGGEKLTATGVAIGTPEYMSPEQAAGSKDLDGRSDLYSLGCVLYEMLGGQPPFTGPTVESVVRQHLATEPPSIASIRPAVPGWVAVTLSRALAKTPADRFNPVALFGEALSGHTIAALRGEPGVTRRWSMYARFGAVGSAVLVLAVVSYFAVGASRDVAPDVSVPRLAVLPFENLGLPDDEFFAQGMTDELAARLSVVSGLTVIARKSAARYKGTAKSPQQIGEELGADYLLDATVSWQRNIAGDSRVRIRPQLVRAGDATHVWADVFDEDLNDVFAVQTAIATKVVEALGTVLLAAEQHVVAARPTEGIAAYQDYLRGKFLFAQRDSQMLVRAVDAFQRAMQLDTAFSQARAGLAMSYAQMVDYGWVPEATDPESLLRLGLAALDTTLPGSARSPETWVARTYLLEQMGALKLAEAAAQRAISLDSNHVEAHNRLSVVLLLSGRDSAAEREARRTLALDAGWHIPFYVLGRAAFVAGRLLDAAALLDTALTLAPDFTAGHLYRARIRMMLGDTAGARVDANALSGSDRALIHVLLAVARGSESAALAKVDSLLEEELRDEGPLEAAVSILIALGRHERAIDLLERSPASDNYLRLREPTWTPIREHPRFRRLFAAAERRASGM